MDEGPNLEPNESENAARPTGPTVHLPIDGMYVLRYRVTPSGMPIPFGSTEVINSIAISVSATDSMPSLLLEFFGELPVTKSTMLSGEFEPTGEEGTNYQIIYDGEHNRLECRFPIPRGSGQVYEWNATLRPRTILPLVRIPVRIYRL